MTRPPTNLSPSKSRYLVFFEYVLLALCLCVIALRTTFAEAPTVQSSSSPGNLSDAVYGLSVSAVLIFSFVVWLLWSFCSGRFLYRYSGIEIGLGVFCVAAVIAGLGAGDKRLAITNFAVFLAPILMAILLVQILDSRTKIKLVLVVIAALGIVTAHQAADQFFRSNQMTIEQYQQDPATLLGPLGIEANTFQHFLFEHRVYSRGVRAFFTTRNSAASFALLAFFAAAALFIDALRNRKAGSSLLHVLAGGMVAAVILFSLVLTRSKGAFIGLFAATVVFGAFLRFGNWLRAHRKALFIGCLLLSIVGVAAVASYGLNNGRLPGGSSMLVRWQYWRAAAKMYADHPLRGVGPGNFAGFYTHYKSGAALESVSDPHNFPLSILTQYGPLGLVGFLAMIVMPIWAVLSPDAARSPSKAGGFAFGKLAIIFAIIVSAAMLFIRPILSPLPAGASAEERQAGIIILYMMPVFVFLVGLLLVSVGQGQPTKRRPSVIAAALFSAAIGLLVHNLIDFAIFEPGVFTTFWAIIACLIAADYNGSSRVHFVLKPAPIVRLLSLAGAFAVIFAYLSCALIPVAVTTAKVHRAYQAVTYNQFDYAHQVLDSAANDDTLSPAALALNGRLYVRHFKETQKQNRDLLVKSEQCLLGAIERSGADYKNFERLAEVYMLLAETASPQDPTGWADKAFESASQAVRRYAGCARLRVKLARIAEQLGKTEVAIEEYQTAIGIEDSYRRQFEAIYPEMEDTVSRLGEDKYYFAKERLKSLLEQESP